MILGSFCSKLNALSNDIPVYLILVCLLPFFFKVEKFAGNEPIFRKNGQKEFKYHQLIVLIKYFLTEFFFLTFSKVMIFLIVKKK